MKTETFRLVLCYLSNHFVTAKEDSLQEWVASWKKNAPLQNTPQTSKTSYIKNKTQLFLL